jgi:hypothetical protein
MNPGEAVAEYDSGTPLPDLEVGREEKVPRDVGLHCRIERFLPLDSPIGCMRVDSCHWKLRLILHKIFQLRPKS